jgi:hypothetical protein
MSHAPPPASVAGVAAGIRHVCDTTPLMRHFQRCGAADSIVVLRAPSALGTGKREAAMRMMATVAAAFLALACNAWHVSAQRPRADADAPNRQAARAVVNAFGKHLRLVATLAPRAIAAAAIDQAYTDLVAPELLAAWKAHPETAPGKHVSSPSPERIDIGAIRAKGRQIFEVTGKVILLTAQERRDGGVFQANPVTITVARQHGKWLIVAYAEREVPP